jgi:pimeloyl-ACP methyl ester carboxylesterase
LVDRHALLIHGAGGGGWEWNPWRGVLQAHGITVHAPDLMPSPIGLAATTLDDYRSQMLQALIAMPRPRVVMGASLGGLLAMLVAEHADALVLVNPLPPAPWHGGLPARTWLDVVPWQRNARLASTRAALSDADDATVLYACRHWRDESGAALQAAYAGIEVERPRCPALLVVSAADEDVPTHISIDIAKLWQAERLETLATSHVGPLLGRYAPQIAMQTVAWLNNAWVVR